MKRLFLFISLGCLVSVLALAQRERPKNQPYADFKMFHLGFHVGIHAQDLILTNTGVSENGEILFAEVPSYSPGFSVGVIGDMFMNPYMNLRFTPSLHFGDKKITYIEQSTQETFTTDVRSSYLSFPLGVKYTAVRLNNYRPYLYGGVYGAFDLGRKKGNPILLKGADFGVEIGFGCDLYLPYFKLCPELKFSFGLVDLLEKNREDLNDTETIKYTNALSKATSRMIVLTFNFE
ncbi:porin family protein [Massilibacteroides sp.]|uniref:type IX secretion/gliding motility protein PorT/SprT n=1 Tax=Massilibacteroides sp. TaxID=2034766 RepID=UPI0026071169|nr:porin family protein [Massilibacteroides sp.]MDD4514315.1 porin family protein [Massilibacteroides sp.]